LPETVVLRSSRLKWLALLLASMVFVLGGALIFFAAPNGRGGGVVVAGFFGLTAVLALVQLLAPGRIELSPDGFTIYGLGTRRTTPWSDVSSFSTAQASALSKIVTVNPADSRSLGRAGAAVRKVVGFNRALPDTYGLSAEDLAALMNDWHRRYTGHS
jgi:hypothetical protein